MRVFVCVCVCVCVWVCVCVCKHCPDTTVCNRHNTMCEHRSHFEKRTRKPLETVPLTIKRLCERGKRRTFAVAPIIQRAQSVEWDHCEVGPLWTSGSDSGGGRGAVSTVNSHSNSTHPGPDRIVPYSPVLRAHVSIDHLPSGFCAIASTRKRSVEL